MPSSINTALLFGALLSAIAALLHVGIIFGGPSWYRFFGAGERMASAAAAGRIYPTMVTLAIATILLLWAAYALSGSGILPPLPLRKLALMAITAVYLVRGMAALGLYIGARRKPSAFWIWSSAICMVYGLVHLTGLVQVWPTL